MSAPLGLSGQMATQVVAAFVLHAVWQAPLLAAAAWLAIRIGRPQARLAHVLWTATLLLCVLMPVGATITGRRAALESERAAAVRVTYVAEDYAGPLPAMQRMPAWQRMLHRHLNVRDGMTPFAFTLPVGVARGITVAYLLIAFFFALHMAMGLRRSRRLVARSPELPAQSALARALYQQCDALGMAAPPVRVCGEIAGPALAGAFHPTLLLPACAGQMSETETEAVLAHELAHLRRHDPPVHLACSMLLVPVGFHPAALWVARRVRQTREMACDAEAAQRMGSSARYARALLQVAERTGAGGRVAGLGLFQNGLGLFNTGLELELMSGAMEERMQVMMNVSGSGSATVRAARWSACVLIGGVAFLSAAMVQVRPVQAQQQIVVAVPKTDTPAPEMVVLDDGQPQLLGGAHAEQQLRKARRDLDTAASAATTDDERNKIATARAVLGAAEQQLAAAGGDAPGRVMIFDPQVRVHLEQLGVELKDLKMDPKVRVQMGALKDLRIDPKGNIEIKDLKLDPRVRMQLEKLDGEQLRIDVEKHRADFEKLNAEMQSPEFQARLHAQVDAASKLSKEQIQKMVEDAQQQQAHATAMLLAGELERQVADAQRQVAAANSTVALMEVPAGMDPPKSFFMLRPDAQAPSAEQTKPVKIESGKMASNKLSGNVPYYPQIAKDAKISGTVVLHVIIDETGNVEDAQVVSSPDKSLAESALTTVMGWKYRPYLLNGNPTPVETTVNVNYHLGG